MEPAHTYPQKSVAFETVKSTGLGFLGGAGVTYGLIKIFNRAKTGNWALTGGQLAFSAAVGGLIGATRGFDRSRVAQIYNDRAGLLNKYQGIPDIQQDILLQTGSPANFAIHRPWPERALSQLNNISVLGWLFCGVVSDSRKLANFFMTTSGLTAAGWLGAHILGIEHIKEKQHEALGYVEKLALQRAAARTAPASQSARA